MSNYELTPLWIGKTFCYKKEFFFRREYPSANSLRLATQAYNDVSRKTAKTKKVYFIDLDSKVEKNLKHFLDDVHYTEEGTKKVAKLVANKII
tara:strand:+ start:44 stop:322 length:279 start_codon:yes stop_codon:yes gene_type:complete